MPRTVHYPDMIAPISKATPLDYALMGVTAFVWASAFVAIKVVVPETGPLWLATWRVLIGFIVLTPYVLWRGVVLPKGGSVWLWLTVAAIFNVTLPFFLISWAEQTIDAGVASLLMGTGPFLALIGSHLSTDDDKLTLPKTIAVMLGFAGVVTIVGVDALSGLGGENTLAQLAAVAGAMSYVIAGLMVRKIDLPPLRMGWLILGIGAAILLVLAPLISGAPNLSLGPTAFWALVYLGLFPTGLGQILRMVLITKVGYSVFSLSLNLIPIIGVGLGALLLGEVITIRTALALVLVLSGLFISRMEFGGKAKKA
ncbi:DMT family transporter [Pseudahrensia aquimaris]|uniref:DMT family transporter n=1 Tax=Pseudahrensia aquimaris TaxID=744461 RepID=A0ABW3FIR9_9HYPH